MWGFAMIWLGILVGSSMRSVEAVNGLMFATMFPITFLANTFAPTENMPSGLRTIAEWNPLSSLVQAVRELWGSPLPPADDPALPLQYPVHQHADLDGRTDRGTGAARPPRVQAPHVRLIGHPAAGETNRLRTSRNTSGCSECTQWPAPLTVTRRLRGNSRSIAATCSGAT